MKRGAHTTTRTGLLLLVLSAVLMVAMVAVLFGHPAPWRVVGACVLGLVAMVLVVIADVLGG